MDTPIDRRPYNLLRVGAAGNVQVPPEALEVEALELVDAVQGEPGADGGELGVPGRQVLPDLAREEHARQRDRAPVARHELQVGTLHEALDVDEAH